MFLGNFERAVAAADLIRETVTGEALRTDNPLVFRYLEAFYGMKVHVLIRFGRWDELKAMELPEQTDLYPSTLALCHYGKGVCVRGDRRYRGRRGATATVRKRLGRCA